MRVSLRCGGSPLERQTWPLELPEQQDDMVALASRDRTERLRILKEDCV